ncbi:LytR C-terminal domain-containing protein [Nostocoides vanveenii]|uniref:LytR/CpsA/Psr regulator C-terminal domain-containing protein n=1 Tax=Nostocoides vanveenii TaxID=330835 RepID=A0ABP4XCY2_9MICO
MTQVPVAPDDARRAIRWRQRRRFVLLITLPGLIVGGASVAGAYGAGLLTRKPAIACVSAVVPAPARDSFDILVTNSNETAGQGGKVAKALTKRGFVVKDVSNAPDGVYIKRAAMIYHGPKGLDQALLVAAQIPGARTWNDGRGGSTVEVVIGYGFTGLKPVPPPPAPLPSEITVNVYNTTWRAGLAATVADDLASRGFHLGTVGNDPLRSFLPDDIAVIRFGPDGADAAATVQQNLPGARMQQDAREGSGVDLVIGNGFTSLLEKSQVPRPPKRVAPPAETVARPCAAG